MASLFLDTNCLIDIIENRDPSLRARVEPHTVSISVLSLPILVYVGKYKIPHEKLQLIGKYFHLAPLSTQVATQSLSGPTSDYEDNIQLYTAVANKCELFLTRDKGLLKLKKFEFLKIFSPDDLAEKTRIS
jgi:predicted nucleic acid-binding protein